MLADVLENSPEDVIKILIEYSGTDSFDGSRTTAFTEAANQIEDTYDKTLHYFRLSLDPNPYERTTTINDDENYEIANFLLKVLSKEEP